MQLDRRHFMKLGLQSGLTYLSLQQLQGPLAFAATNRTEDPSPLRPLRGGFSNSQFNGDDYTKPHHILWDLPAYIQSKGGRPQIRERHDVIIVGGGVSGLSSAYFLQDRKPLVLEQSTQLGGNSRGEIYENIPFSIGAAYMTVPENGSSIAKMLHTVGAASAARHEPESATRIFKTPDRFISLGSDASPSDQNAIKQIAADFRQIADQSYPNIPWQPGGLSRQGLEQWDSMTFLQWLQQRYGSNIPTDLMEYFQLYCWSSFGGSIDEISAAQALNFLTAETEGIISFPGGNSYVTQCLTQYLLKKLGPEALRPNTFVLEVRTTSEGVEVLIETPQGELQTLLCQNCVVAVPKNVAYFLVPEMTEAQKRLAQSIRYRAYLVANVLLKDVVPSPCFDSYRLEGQVPPTPRFGHPPKRPYTDICFANWAIGDRGHRSILTLYKPLPFEGARNTIYDGPAFPRIQQEVLDSLPELLQALRVPPQSMSGLRLTRWGHSVPLAAPGFFASKQDQVFRSTTPQRIHYVNQDNDVNPAFESAFANAEIISQKILQQRIK